MAHNEEKWQIRKSKGKKEEKGQEGREKARRKINNKKGWNLQGRKTKVQEGR